MATIRTRIVAMTRLDLLLRAGRGERWEAAPEIDACSATAWWTRVWWLLSLSDAGANIRGWPRGMGDVGLFHQFKMARPFFQISFGCVFRKPAEVNLLHTLPADRQPFFPPFHFFHFMRDNFFILCAN